MKSNGIKVLVGCEESQAVCKAFRKRGFEAYSCDLIPCSGGHPEWHLQMDVLRAIRGAGHKNGKTGWLLNERREVVFIDKWDAAVFFPDCTYLTCSAEWAYKEGPYHQKVKPGTLVGKERTEARAEAYEFFMALWNSDIENLAIENPVGVMSRFFRKPDQIIQPWKFGDDASKKTCLWLKDLPLLHHSVENYISPRLVSSGITESDFAYRWGNQTDSGQNKLSPSDDRAKLRSKTYQGIADAMASQWGLYLTKPEMHKILYA